MIFIPNINKKKKKTQYLNCWWCGKKITIESKNKDVKVIKGVCCLICNINFERKAKSILEGMKDNNSF